MSAVSRGFRCTHGAPLGACMERACEWWNGRDPDEPERVAIDQLAAESQPAFPETYAPHRLPIPPDLTVHEATVEEVASVPDPSLYKGGEDWYYREPGNYGPHRDNPIMVNGRVRYQADQTVHVNGARPATPTAHKTVARELSESQARERFEAAQHVPESPARAWREKGKAS